MQTRRMKCNRFFVKASILRIVISPTPNPEFNLTKLQALLIMLPNLALFSFAGNNSSSLDKTSIGSIYQTA